jgi:hypothetical protein
MRLHEEVGSVYCGDDVVGGGGSDGADAGHTYVADRMVSYGLSG